MLNLTDNLIRKLDQNKRTLLFAGVETLIIIILLAIVIWRKDPPQFKVQDIEARLRDSIADNMREYQKLQKHIETLNYRYDSLAQIKTNIQLIYETKIKYIERQPVDTSYNFIRRYLKGTN